MMQVEALIIPASNANFDFGFMNLSDRENLEFVLYIFFSKREGIRLAKKANVSVLYKNKMEHEIVGCSLPRKDSRKNIRIDGLAAMTLSFGLQLLHLFTRVSNLGIIESGIGENHVFSICVPEENAISQDVLFGVKKDGVYEILIAFSKGQVEEILDRYGNCFSAQDETSLRNAILFSSLPEHANRAVTTIGDDTAKMLCMALLLYNTQEFQILGDPSTIDSLYLRVGDAEDGSGEALSPEDWN